MESSFYSYYYISTDCLSNTMDTKSIEKYLCSKGFQSVGKGYYKLDNEFCTVQLMNVKSYDSWNSNDYNTIETNYISITTSKSISDNLKQFFSDFSEFAGWRVREEHE